MDGFAQKVAQSATKKPDNEDNKDQDADAAKDGWKSKMAELLGPFCLLWEKVGNGGSYFLWDADEPAQPKFAGFLSVYSDVD